MIDTDKYEGHTEFKWRWYEGARHKALIGVLLFAEDGNNVHPNPADAQLIADAPLLLEAYKRLRLVADELYLHIVGEPHMTLDELVAEMPWRNEE